MERRFCDLHAHSNYSDGTYTPKELIEEAERIGLSAVALTDHNTVAGLPSFLAAAKGKAVEAIPGIEISTDYGKTELHILGLFLEERYYDAITERLVPLSINKERSNVALIHALAEAGYDITYEEVAARVPDGQFNRSHVGEVLTEKGYTPSIAEAFQTVLSKETGFYEQPERLPVFETISFLKSIGATVVLAHPFLNLGEGELRVFLAEAVKHGLDGMETVYSTYKEETARKAREIAAEFGIIESGGSDFHGGRKPDIALGTGKGALAVPAEFADNLKNGRKRGNCLGTEDQMV